MAEKASISGDADDERPDSAGERVQSVRVYECGNGLLAAPIGVVLMLVMSIVDVRVFVIQGQMAMHVRVVFREMQPHSGSHEESGDK
jgi:hypothetical protein